MPAYVAIAYEYLFKDHPANFSAWMGAISDGAQYFGRLSARASKIAKNISNCTTLFQIGYDLPLAFQSFRIAYDRYYKISTFDAQPSQQEVKKPGPITLDICKVISSGVLLVDFTRRHIFEANPSSFMNLLGALADISKNGYEFYLYHQDRKKEAKTFFSSDVRTLSFLCQKTSQLFLAGLSLISIYKGKENTAPLLSLFLTTIYLGSHFTFYYKTHPHRERRIRIIQD
ncbi:MAG: hypothetical protein JSS10_01895 [Verrucomicrobia bacterium]|nr:hypothetical protein [Verrucomicrobiota bacterium]